MPRPNTFISVGKLIVALSVIGAIGWVSALDPDCYYTMDILAQYRYCGPEFAGTELPINFKALALLLSGIAVGLFFIGLGKYAARKKLAK